MFHFFGAKSFHRSYLSLGLGKPHQMCKLLKSILFIWCCTNSVNPEAKHSLHLSTPAHRSRTRIARIQPLTPIITFDRILLKGNSRWENIRLFLLSNLRIETLGWGETLECLPFCVRHLPLSDVCGGKQGEEEQGQEGRWRVHQDQELGGLCPLLLPAKKFVLISSLWCNSSGLHLPRSRWKLQIVEQRRIVKEHLLASSNSDFNSGNSINIEREGGEGMGREQKLHLMSESGSNLDVSTTWMIKEGERWKGEDVDCKM